MFLCFVLAHAMHYPPPLRPSPRPEHTQRTTWRECGGEGEEEEPVAANDGEGPGDAAVRMKSSGIGRVLNDGKPLACGHCAGHFHKGGVGGELRSVDVSPQGVSS